MAEYGLRSVHVTCLYYLYSSESLTATELCELCEEDKATISRALDFLEENGYIVCETMQSKRYKAPLLLTEKGAEVGKKITDKINFVLDEICIDLTEERLIGAIIVGTGLPQVCNEREILKNYFDSKGENGFSYSYLYTGMNKVQQAE